MKTGTEYYDGYGRIATTARILLMIDRVSIDDMSRIGLLPLKHQSYRFISTIYQTKVQYNDYLKNLMLSEIMEASEYLDILTDDDLVKNFLKVNQKEKVLLKSIDLFLNQNIQNVLKSFSIKSIELR